MIDNPLPCDIGAFVTIQETIMRLRAIGLISTLTLGLLGAPLPGEAQQAGKVHRISYLTSTSEARSFWKALHELGYVEGQNIVIVRRLAQGGIRPSWVLNEAFK